MNPLTPNDEAFLADELDCALTRRHADRDPSGEVAKLVKLAQLLEATWSTSAMPTEEFRTATRRRLVAQIAPMRSPKLAPAPRRRSALTLATEHVNAWLLRLVAALTAVSLAGAATAGASSALPGDALYPVKQVTEAIALQTATSDEVRQQIILLQADARLEETGQLLALGRDADADANADRYDQTIEQAAAAVDAMPSAESSRAELEARLQAHRATLADLLQDAPPPARAGLERAIGAADRHLARTEGKTDNPAVAPAITSPNRAQPTPQPSAPSKPAESITHTPGAPPPIGSPTNEPSARDAAEQR
jgi:hypothetical protein